MASGRKLYPPLATDSEVNNIVLVYTKTVR